MDTFSCDSQGNSSTPRHTTQRPAGSAMAPLVSSESFPARFGAAVPQNQAENQWTLGPLNGPQLGISTPEKNLKKNTEKN